MNIKKSSRHSKITGDFAEGLVLYWLSKYGYECARIDHVGIDLIACTPDGSQRMGISVKCRSRFDGKENEPITLPSDGFAKAKQACNAFGLVPYYAMVVDGANFIRCYVLPMEHLQKIAGGSMDGTRYWQMSGQNIEKYKNDPLIEKFELQTLACSWRDRPTE